VCTIAQYIPFVLNGAANKTTHAPHNHCRLNPLNTPTAPALSTVFPF